MFGINSSAANIIHRVSTLANNIGGFFRLTDSDERLQTNQTTETTPTNTREHREKVIAQDLEKDGFANQAILPQVQFILTYIEAIKRDYNLLRLNDAELTLLDTKIQQLENHIKLGFNENTHCIETPDSPFSLELKQIFTELVESVQGLVDSQAQLNFDLISSHLSQLSHRVNTLFGLCISLKDYAKARFEHSKQAPSNEFNAYKKYLIFLLPILHQELNALANKIKGFKGSRTDEIKNAVITPIQAEIATLINLLNQTDLTLNLPLSYQEFESLVNLTRMLARGRSALQQHSEFMADVANKIPASNERLAPIKAKCTSIAEYVAGFEKYTAANIATINSFVDLFDEKLTEKVHNKTLVHNTLTDDLPILFSILKQELELFDNKMTELTEFECEENLEAHLSATKLLISSFTRSLNKYGFYFDNFLDLERAIDAISLLEKDLIQLDEVIPENANPSHRKFHQYKAKLLSLIVKLQSISTQIKADLLPDFHQRVLLTKGIFSNLALAITNWKEDQEENCSRKTIKKVKGQNYFTYELLSEYKQFQEALTHKNTVEICDTVTELDQLIASELSPLELIPIIVNFYKTIHDNTEFLDSTSLPPKLAQFTDLVRPYLALICELIYPYIHDEFTHRHITKLKDRSELLEKLKTYRSERINRLVALDKTTDKDFDFSNQLSELEEENIVLPNAEFSNHVKNDTCMLVKKAEQYPVDLYHFSHNFFAFTSSILKTNRDLYSLIEKEANTVLKALQPIFSNEDPVSFENLFLISNLDLALEDIKTALQKLTNKVLDRQKLKQIYDLMSQIDQINIKTISIINGNKETVRDAFENKIFKQINNLIENFADLDNLVLSNPDYAPKINDTLSLLEMKKHLDIVLDMNVQDTKDISSQFLFHLMKIYQLSSKANECLEAFNLEIQPYHLTVDEVINAGKTLKKQINELCTENIDNNVFISPDELFTLAENISELFNCHPETFGIAKTLDEDTFNKMICLVTHKGRLASNMKLATSKPIYLSEEDRTDNFAPLKAAYNEHFFKNESINEVEHSLLYLTENDSVFKALNIEDDLLWQKNKFKYLLVNELKLTNFHKELILGNKHKITRSEKEDDYKKMHQELDLALLLLSDNEYKKQDMTQDDFIRRILFLAFEIEKSNDRSDLAIKFLQVLESAKKEYGSDVNKIFGLTEKAIFAKSKAPVNLQTSTKKEDKNYLNNQLTNDESLPFASLEDIYHNLLKEKSHYLNQARENIQATNLTQEYTELLKKELTLMLNLKVLNNLSLSPKSKATFTLSGLYKTQPEYSINHLNFPLFQNSELYLKREEEINTYLTDYSVNLSLKDHLSYFENIK